MLRYAHVYILSLVYIASAKNEKNILRKIIPQSAQFLPSNSEYNWNDKTPCLANLAIDNITGKNFTQFFSNLNSNEFDQKSTEYRSDFWSKKLRYQTCKLNAISKQGDHFSLNLRMDEKIDLVKVYQRIDDGKNHRVICVP